LNSPTKFYTNTYLKQFELLYGPFLSYIPLVLLKPKPFICIAVAYQSTSPDHTA